jgi:hypothetical protein
VDNFLTFYRVQDKMILEVPPDRIVVFITAFLQRIGLGAFVWTNLIEVIKNNQRKTPLRAFFIALLV